MKLVTFVTGPQGNSRERKGVVEPILPTYYLNLNTNLNLSVTQKHGKVSSLNR